MNERHEPRDTRNMTDTKKEVNDPPVFLRAHTPDKIKMSWMHSYVVRHGTKITHRKCCFDPENCCDMLCTHFKVATVTHIASKGYVFHVGCFCHKFDPPHEMEELKIYPLDKEEN